jgi:hypothetical protein
MSLSKKELIDLMNLLKEPTGTENFKNLCKLTQGFVEAEMH